MRKKEKNSSTNKEDFKYGPFFSSLITNTQTVLNIFFKAEKYIEQKLKPRRQRIAGTNENVTRQILFTPSLIYTLVHPLSFIRLFIKLIIGSIVVYISSLSKIKNISMHDKGTRPDYIIRNSIDYNIDLNDKKNNLPLGIIAKMRHILGLKPLQIEAQLERPFIYAKRSILCDAEETENIYIRINMTTDSELGNSGAFISLNELGTKYPLFKFSQFAHIITHNILCMFITEVITNFIFFHTTYFLREYLLKQNKINLNNCIKSYKEVKPQIPYKAIFVFSFNHTISNTLLMLLVTRIWRRSLSGLLLRFIELNYAKKSISNEKITFTICDEIKEYLSNQFSCNEISAPIGYSTYKNYLSINQKIGYDNSSALDIVCKNEKFYRLYGLSAALENHCMFLIHQIGFGHFIIPNIFITQNTYMKYALLIVNMIIKMPFLHAKLFYVCTLSLLVGRVIYDDQYYYNDRYSGGSYGSYSQRKYYHRSRS